MAENTNVADFDAAIAGGGLAGLTLALALAGKTSGTGFRVVVIDRQAHDARLDAGFDGRALALSPSSRMMLGALDLWPRLKGDATKIRKMVITDSRPGQRVRPVFLTFEEEADSGGALAYMVEVRHLYRVLLEEIASSPDIVLMAPATVRGVEDGNSRAALALEGGRAVTARLVAACDGRASPLRRQAGIKTVNWAYGQTGIVTTVAHEKAHDGTAYDHFLPAGPFAVLPLPGNRSSLVWTETDDDARAIMALGDSDFADVMRMRFGPAMGRAEPVGPRWSYPLTFHLARRYWHGRLALVGDAAHATHPISGLGFNLGLRDIAALAEVLIDAARLGLDIADATVLARYERWRRFDNAAIALGNDTLNRMFSNDNSVLRLARDVGLGIVERTPALKGFFRKQAAGLSGDGPRLLRGEAV